MKKAVFEGLVIDEYDRPAEVVYVGEEPCYVVDDFGFRRHIPSEQVDTQVFAAMLDMIEGHEDLLSTQTAKMLGSEDPFSVAMIENQLKNIDQQMSTLIQTGIPEELRAYLGMMGFKIRINIHGEIIEVEQPGMTADDEE
ncbi:MAG: hypothetical protein B6D39_05335 [Anaerolineae bacterium UTCFX2]|jgi:hypothetical protein|nr:hypothetical protein [Anaerolineales bacterium]OQY92101.1 MAG: hypothetical protein B6D39_05335 [Anaerolineae bacterium UTCFX2]